MSLPHYDLTNTKRAKAVASGAIELRTIEDTVKKFKEIKASRQWKIEHARLNRSFFGKEK